MMGQQVFEKYDSKINVDEFAILDIINCNKELCQRDLAKMILKDRANTGKLLDALEKKGFVIRRLTIRNNRPVKIIEITEKGRSVVEDTGDKIRPEYKKVKEQINNSDVIKIKDLLKELRDMLKNTLEIQI